MLTLNDGRSELWQWDTGRTLTVDTDCSQVHFSNKVFGRSIDVDVVDGAAIIPDVLLQTDNDLNVWAFSGTAENGYTKISKTFKVNRRNKPADYVFTPTDQMTLQMIQRQIGDLADLTTEEKDTLVAAINEAARTGGGGGGSAVELDTTLTQSGKAADAKAVGDAINRVNSAIEAKQDHLTEHDKQEVVLTGLTTGAVWTDTEKQKAWSQLSIIRNALDDGIAVAGTQYYLGERKIVSIVLPDDALIGQMITVSWYNGNTAATLSITGTILSFDYTPSANTRSEINALWDGTYWAVLGNEMAVPSEVTA